MKTHLETVLDWPQDILNTLSYIPKYLSFENRPRFLGLYIMITSKVIVLGEIFLM